MRTKKVITKTKYVPVQHADLLKAQLENIHELSK